MEIYDSEDKLIKRIDSISDDMARFISKEGCNQFPTVLFLANRMFVSDDINLIKDLNLDDLSQCDIASFIKYFKSSIMNYNELNYKD